MSTEPEITRMSLNEFNEHIEKIIEKNELELKAKNAPVPNKESSIAKINQNTFDLDSLKEYKSSVNLQTVSLNGVLNNTTTHASVLEVKKEGSAEPVYYVFSAAVSLAKIFVINPTTIRVWLSKNKEVFYPDAEIECKLYYKPLEEINILHGKD
jgi:hypothetical protein